MSDPRTGAQINAHIAQMLKTVSELAEAMKLRQYAVERAIEALKSTPFPSGDTAIKSHLDLAEQLHGFLARPALDATAQIRSAIAS